MSHVPIEESEQGGPRLDLQNVRFSYFQIIGKCSGIVVDIAHTHPKPTFQQCSDKA